MESYSSGAPEERSRSAAQKAIALVGPFMIVGVHVREKVWLDKMRLVEAALGAGPRWPTPTT